MTMKKVLVVEDDKGLSMAYKVRLGHEGYEVLLATDGAEGLEKMRAERPHVVLLDLLMPGMTGEQMLTAVALEGGELAKIPVIVLSNFGQTSDLDRVKTLGARECLMKSNLSLTEVVDVVRKYAP